LLIDSLSSLFGHVQLSGDLSGGLDPSVDGLLSESVSNLQLCLNLLSLLLDKRVSRLLSFAELLGFLFSLLPNSEEDAFSEQLGRPKFGVDLLTFSLDNQSSGLSSLVNLFLGLLSSLKDVIKGLLSELFSSLTLFRIGLCSFGSELNHQISSLTFGISEPGFGVLELGVSIESPLSSFEELLFDIFTRWWSSSLATQLLELLLDC